MSVPIKACVIGDPVTHSLSPKLHGYWLKTYGINGTYEAVQVTQQTLQNFLRTLAQQGFAGCNITLPHKEAALQYMDDISDVAQKVGAINTVIVQKDGSLYGTNTDVYGFKENIIPAIWSIKTPQKKALILGAGGAARGVCLALRELGFSMVLTNRTRSKAQAIADVLENIDVVDWDAKASALRDVDLLVNTTSLGLLGKEGLDISLDLLPINAVVSDIVYNPLYTPLLCEAQKRGNVVVTGIGMLLHQAAPGFEAWFGIKPQIDEALERHVLGVDR